MKVFTKKGQSVLEYAFVLVGVIVAIVAIQLYMKRGIEGRIAEATNDIGHQFRLRNTNVATDPSSAEHIKTSRESTTVQITDGDIIATVTQAGSTRESTLFVDPYQP